MGCYSPVRAWRGPVSPSGKRPLVFKRPGDRQEAFPLRVPCGGCFGCRLEYSRQWALRCMHEAESHSENCVLTLTYRDEDLPAGGSLDYRDFDLFMKRFRLEAGKPLRFYQCGEYGEKLSRPHHHVLVFGFDFPDKRLFTRTVNGSRLYTSDMADRLWRKGHTLVGDLTYESAAYVSRYVMKKIKGKKALDFYGEKLPEKCTMSRRPGIGAEWFAKFGRDVYPSDQVIVGGYPQKPPRFYDSRLELLDPTLFNRLKRARVVRGKRMVPHVLANGKTIMVDDNDSFRLVVKEEVKKAQMSSLKRRFENGE